MGNIVQQCPSEGKERYKYIGKYTAFFLFQAMLLTFAIFVFASGPLPSCSDSNPNSCGCNFITSMNSGEIFSCQQADVYVDFNDACLVGNQNYCCDTCDQGLGICIVCTDQVTTQSIIWAGVLLIVAEVVMLLITLYLYAGPGPKQIKKKQKQVPMLTSNLIK